MVEEDIDIAKLFEPGDREALRTYVRLLHPADIAELFDLLKEDHWTTLAAELSSETLAETMTHLEDYQIAALGEVLNTERLVEALDELETDDATDLLADLPDEKTEAVLERLEDKEDIETLLAYPEDSAGGIMQTEVCVVPEGRNVADAIDAVRDIREEIEDVFDVYVVDDVGRLVGTVALEDLVLSRADTPLREIREPIEAQVTTDIDQEEVAALFKKYDVPALPVVDSVGVLVGRITFDDVHDVLEEEASEDILTMAGASPEDLVYSSHFLRIAVLRMPWLMASLLGSLVTTQLVPMFSSVPGDTIVLAAFVPVVMAMTGNVGSQSAMIVTRGFAVGKIDFQSLGRTFFREVSVGVMMGLVAGSVVAGFAHVVYGNSILGVALGLSMITSMSLASLIGTAAPALFKHIGIDPAIAAGPLVTTGCDVLGVAIYLVVAIAVLA